MRSGDKQAFERLLKWLTHSLSPQMPALRAIFNCFAIIFWLLAVLFPMVVTSSGLHWWQQPWPHRVTRALVWAMAIIMTGLAIIYVFFLTPLFLIGLWSGKITFSGTKGVFKKFATIALPCLQVVMAVWSDAYVAGQSSPLLSAITLMLYALFYISSIVIILYQIYTGIRRVRQSAV